MDFRILGPIEVRDGSGVVSLGGPKPQAVLVMLLLHLGEPVSVDRLAQALWGEDAPSSAIKNVQVHVSRLRKALGRADLIATTPSGYCLRAEPDELDAARFTRLVAQGRGDLAGGRPESAAVLLREALDLWRGPALGDMAFEPYAQVEVERLEALRLSAEELRLDADLVLGRQAAVVEELQRLSAAHPKHERFAAQLMLALYRCGRQLEALEFYRLRRALLVDEFGVEPGPELRDLQAAILRQDVSLSPAVELPRALDASAQPRLVGRERELGWLRERWARARAGTGALVRVVGERGIGKRRLAAELAGEAHRAGADVLYADDPESARAAVERMCAPPRPLLLVADADQPGVQAELADAADGLDRRPVLVVACGEAIDGGDDGALPVAPLAPEAVAEIARGYGVPPEPWLLAEARGIPGAIHQLARDWTRREAERRVGAAAARAQAGRTELRSIEAELAGGVSELQAAVDLRRGHGVVLCPFKGLASFGVDDAPFFFGRERLVAELVARLAGAPLLGVVGPSGSGKSSVVQAGLLPALANGVLPASAQRRQALMRPGEHPLEELRAVLARGGARPVLAVDQFEETFTVCRDEPERAAFLAELVDLANAGEAILVLALRADYYGRCASYAGLSELLAANHVLVGPMRRDELRQAVVYPARSAGLEVEPELVDELVADVHGAPGALPLLSTALLELWQRREGRRLRRASYAELGGVHGAVGRLAEEVFGRLTPAQQSEARSVILRLVGEGPDGAAERRRVRLDRFDEDVKPVLRRLADGRLLTVGAGSVEVAHEALLREWPRLQRWLEDDRENLAIHRRLTVAAQEWRELGGREDTLYHGARLAEALEWEAATPSRLDDTERSFLAASRAFADRERRARRRRAGIVISGLVVLLLAISVVAAVAVHQRGQAERERDLGTSRDLAFKAMTLQDVDPGLSLVLALRALDSAETAQAAAEVRQAVLGFRQLAVMRAGAGRAFGADLDERGTRAVSASTHGELIVWNVADRRRIATIRAHRGAAFSARFVPGRPLLASAGEDGRIVLTGVAGGRGRTLIRAAGDAQSLGVSRDGRRVAGGFTDGSVRVADIDGSGPVRVLRGHRGWVYGVALSPDGALAASAGEDGTVRVWDLRGGAAPLVLEANPNGVASVAFSPGGGRLVAADADGRLHLWDARTGAAQGTIRAADRTLWSVRFGADGRRLVTAAEDGLVRVVDVAGRRVTATLRGHKGPAFDAGFSGTGDRVVSTGDDGTLRVWDPGRARMIRAAVSGVRFDPGGARIVAGSKSGVVRIWDAASGRLLRELRGQTDLGWARFSPDGRHVVGASYDGTARVWDAASGRAEHVFRDHGHDVYAAALDPDSRRLVSAGPDGRVVVRSLHGGPPVTLAGHRGAVVDVAFSPSGRRVISAGDDGTIRIWDPHRPSKAVAVLLGHRRRVNTAAFSADGRRAVSAGIDGTVRVWDLARRTHVVLGGHSGAVDAAAFNRSGDRVVSAGLDGTVRVWDANGGDALVTLQRHRGGATAAAFSPRGSEVVSSGDDGSIRLSDCEVCGSLADVRRIARTRQMHRLTPAERQRYLGPP